MNRNNKLSDNFSLYEMARSETAKRLGIDNTPPVDYIPRLRTLCKTILEPVRAHYGQPYRPNSVYRCLELNRALHSKDTSDHVTAYACDIEIAGVSNYDLAVWIRDNLEFAKIILECYTAGVPNSGWVHVSINPDIKQNTVLTYSGGLFRAGLHK